MKLIEIVDSLLNESRTKQIDTVDEFVELYGKYCSDHNFNNDKIYRGLRNKSLRYGFIQPKNFKRKSAYTQNYYTLIVDNHPKWNRFPDRSRSLVGTSSREYTENFGAAFIVIPFDNASIAVAPAYDFWESFRETLPDQFQNLDHFNEGFTILSKKIYGENLFDVDSFSEFKSSINRLENDIRQIGFKVILDRLESGWRSRNARNLILTLKNCESNFLNCIFKWFEPDKNGFELKKYNSSFTVGRNREVWTDSPCLLIRDDSTYTEFKKLIKNKK